MYNYTKTEWENLISEHIVGLHAKRNRAIIRDKILGGLTIAQTAEKHGLSETRVKTIIRTFKRHIDGL
jgi:DNA-directed RNA polymerase specialized sigma24 family protein